MKLRGAWALVFALGCSAAFAQDPPQSPPKAPPDASKDEPKPGYVTNVYTDADIHSVFSDVGLQAGVTIVTDDSIRDQNVSIEFKNEPVDLAVQRLAMMIGAYWKRDDDGVFLVSKATPDASFFPDFAETEFYTPGNQAATSIAALVSQAYKPYLTVDPKTNIIGVTAPRRLLDRILRDLKKADSPSRQIVVEALVAEVNEDKGKDTGFSWSWKNFAMGDDLSLAYDKISFDDTVKLKALLDQHKATLRANPRITAFEGRETSLVVGQDTYFSLLSGNPAYPYSQIQLVHTGVTLKFTALVASDGTITLELDPEVSDAVVTVNGNPTTTVRRASTNVRVKSGETIALGGLVYETTDRRTTAIPFLGSVPIIGELFKQRTNATHRTEVVILITPRLSEAGAGEKGTDSGRKVEEP